MHFWHKPTIDRFHEIHYEKLKNLHQLTEYWIQGLFKDEDFKLNIYTSPEIKKKIDPVLEFSNNILSKPLHECIDAKPTDEFLDYLEHMIYAFQSWVFQLLDSNTQEQTWIHALHQASFFFGIDFVKKNWKNTNFTSYEEYLTIIHQLPFSGFPKKNNIYVLRNTPQELRFEFFPLVPHFSELDSMKLPITQLYIEVIKGITYAFSSKIKLTFNLNQSSVIFNLN